MQKIPLKMFTSACSALTGRAVLDALRDSSLSTSRTRSEALRDLRVHLRVHLRVCLGDGTRITAQTKATFEPSVSQRLANSEDDNKEEDTSFT